MLLTARFLITDAFQKFIPIASSGAQSTSTFHVASARQWLYTQAKVAQTLSPVSSEFGKPLRKSAVSLIDHRPVWIYWLMQQLSRAIQLYEVEPSFTEALDIAREDFYPLLGYLCRLYPSEGESSLSSCQLSLRSICSFPFLVLSVRYLCNPLRHDLPPQRRQRACLSSLCHRPSS